MVSENSLSPQNDHSSCLKLVKIMERETDHFSDSDYLQNYWKYIGKNFYDRLLARLGYKPYNTQCSEFQNFIKTFEETHSRFKITNLENIPTYINSFGVYYFGSYPNQIMFCNRSVNDQINKIIFGSKHA